MQHVRIILLLPSFAVDLVPFTIVDLLLEQRDSHSDSEAWHVRSWFRGIQEIEDLARSNDAAPDKGKRKLSYFKLYLIPIIRW